MISIRQIRERASDSKLKRELVVVFICALFIAVGVFIAGAITLGPITCCYLFIPMGTIVLWKSITKKF